LRRAPQKLICFAAFFFSNPEATEGAQMAKKLFVGNLSYNVTEDDLKDAFGKVGEVVSAKIITDSATGRSKGFGFVEMAADEDGDKAITTLNGTTLLDRTMNVSEARPQRDKPRGGSGFGGGGGRRGGGGGGFGGGRKHDSWR
jgi:RNA recognition motif-containing protein